MEHVNYPHEPGYLFDCAACEAACHCTPDSSECVFDGEHGPNADSRADCPSHGTQEITAVHSSDGFTGAPVTFTNLACGCQILDDSLDTLDRVR